MTPRGPTCVEPHTAYIEANADEVGPCEFCEETTTKNHGVVKRLHLSGDKITINGLKNLPYTEEVGYNDLIPSITKLCPKFRLMQPLPTTTTTFEITSGTLSAGKTPTDERFSILEVAADGPITLEATQGGVTHLMTLKKSATEVRIVNNSVTMSKGMPQLAMNHWLAFYSLSATPVVCDLPTATSATDQQTTIACSNGTLP